MMRLIYLLFLCFQFKGIATDRSLIAGWNMVTGISGTTDTLFTDNDSIDIVVTYYHGKWFSAYQQNNVNASIKNLDQLNSLLIDQAYYLHLKSSTYLSLSSRDDIDLIPLVNGWNFVGGIHKSFTKLLLQYPHINKIYHLKNEEWKVLVNSSTSNISQLSILDANESYWIQVGLDDLNGAIFEQSVFGISLFQ